MSGKYVIVALCIVGLAKVSQQAVTPTSAVVTSANTVGGVHFELTARKYTLENKFYYLGNTFKANWYNANKFCRSHGMSLASIESSQEYEQFKKIILDAGINEGSFWTSGTDLGQPVNNFFWFSTGRPFTFVNWARGEPDNDFKGTEDCVEVKKNKGSVFEWDDKRCSEENYFVCQLFNF